MFFTLQNASEFWNVCTRPQANNGLALTPEHADKGLRIIERHVRYLPDDTRVYAHWRALVRDHVVRGVQVHDTKLVAAMQAHGIERILTKNTSHFARFQQIRALDPLEIA